MWFRCLLPKVVAANHSRALPNACTAAVTAHSRASRACRPGCLAFCRSPHQPGSRTMPAAKLPAMCRLRGVLACCCFLRQAAAARIQLPPSEEAAADAGALRGHLNSCSHASRDSDASCSRPRQPGAACRRARRRPQRQRRCARSASCCACAPRTTRRSRALRARRPSKSSPCPDYVQWRATQRSHALRTRHPGQP